MAITENERTEFEQLDTKLSTLELLRSADLLAEMTDVRARGYDITFGDTEDAAYEAPETLWEVFDRLDVGGREFDRVARRLTLGIAGLAKGLEHASVPVIGAVRRKLRPKLRDARRELLYGQPDVQAMPWHLQNGKALALGTIVDAHSLYTEVSGGEHPFISGELPADILTHTFGDSASPNIAGLTLRDALQVTAQAFRGKNAEDAARKADKELRDVQAFVATPVQQGFKEIVQFCTDSLGIRSRKEEVRAEIARHVEASDKGDFLMMSVGCGTAQPMLEVMKDVWEKGRTARLILVDQDPVALAAADVLAQKMGLQDAIEIHCAKLFITEGGRLKFMDLQEVLDGRRPDVCEDSGLREYFPDSMYRDLTRQAWESLADDGIMTTGNMNKNRPQPEFLHGLMGWPIKVRMRYVRDVVRLHEEAGIPEDAMRLRITQDGVYTLCFSSKNPVR